MDIFFTEINEFKDLEKNIIDFNKKFILEKKVNILKEISMIGTRYQSGEIDVFQFPAKIFIKIKS